MMNAAVNIYCQPTPLLSPLNFEPGVSTARAVENNEGRTTEDGSIRWTEGIDP